MKWILMCALLCTAGCIVLPSAEDRAELREIRAERTVIMERGEELALKLKKGTISPDEFKLKMVGLLKSEFQLEAREKALVAKGTPTWSVIANGILAALLFVFGGKRNLGGLVKTWGVAVVGRKDK